MEQWLDETLSLDVLRVYNHGKVRLNSDLVARVGNLRHRELTIAEIDFLTNSNVYNISQLLYFFRAYKLNNERIIHTYIDKHNDDMRKEQSILKEMAKKEADARAKQEADRRKAAKEEADARPTQDTAQRKVKRVNDVNGKEKKQRALRALYARRQYTRFIEATIEEPYRIRNFVNRLLEGLNEGCLRFALTDFQRLLKESMVDETCSATCWQLKEFGLLKWEWEGPLAIIESQGILETCFREYLAFIVKSLRPLFSVPYVQHLVVNGHPAGDLTEGSVARF